MSQLVDSPIIPACQTPDLPPRTAWNASVVIAIASALLVVAIAHGMAIYYPEGTLWILKIAFSLAVGALCWMICLRHHRQRTGSAIELEKLISDIRQNTAPIEELSLITGPLAPIAEQVKAVLRELRQQRQVLSEMDAEMRQRVANRTTALERTIQSLRHQATRDPLTGLYNRRMMDELLPRMVRQSVDNKCPLALLMIDVDYFKDLNDTLGHAAGDDMLRALGQLIHSAIRDGDVGFRVGGDEFVVVLSGCESDGATAKADGIRSLVMALTSTLKVARRPKLSIGIATLADIQTPSAEELLRYADEELYAAKAARPDAATAR